MPLSAVALEAAAKVGLLKSETIIDRPETTKRVIQFLSLQPAADLFGVETVAQSIEEITTDVFKSDDQDLRGFVSVLCSLRANGLVQHSLNGGGRMLCGRRHFLSLALPDGSVVKHGVTQRFISSDPEVVKQFLLDRRLAGAIRQAEEVQAICDLTVRRIPALAAELQQRRLATSLQVHALLVPERRES